MFSLIKFKIKCDSLWPNVCPNVVLFGPAWGQKELTHVIEYQCFHEILFKIDLFPFYIQKLSHIWFVYRDKVPYSTVNAIRFLQDTYVKEGVLALWRGNSATMARIVPYAAIQFTSHEQWKKALRVDNNGKTPYLQFLAGSLAGITSQSVTYPLDLARARMAVTHKCEYATLRSVSDH